MRIMVTGSAGMLGQQLESVFSQDHSVLAVDLEDLDITRFDQVRETVAGCQPDWILHAAAFTQVDEAETRVDEAYRVNALGTRNVAAAAHENQSVLLYYSTDYVFDGGQRHPWREWDRPSPVNEYGRSKLAGEHFVRALAPSHLIVRTSWLFGPGGANFVDKMIQRGRLGGPLRVVDDQTGSPTFTKDLAAASKQLVERNLRGIYHVTNSGHCNWYELATEVLTLAGLDIEITPVPTSDYPAAAPRPAFSVLDNFLLRIEGIPLLRSWQEAVAAYLRKPHV